MLTEFLTALGLVQQTAAVIDSAASLTEKVKKMISGPEPDTVAAKLLVLEIAEKLIEARTTQSKQQEVLAQLQKVIERNERFDHEAQRYALQKTDLGGFVYTLKPDHADGQPPHDLCAACFDDRKKSILQFTQMNTLTCPKCGATALKSDGRDSGIRVGRVSRGIWDNFP